MERRRSSPPTATGRREAIFDPQDPTKRPVLDVHGRVVRFVKVGPREMTCLDCGETTAYDHCPRCSEFDQHIIKRNLIPTLQYLQEGEYVVVS